ncbi:semaphorin-5B-like [Elysia marginata]|uniref:Semaphorin-5B-like n=1 Tax=Elysia marginata TaxID=1093978 RepID=A0AAV4I6M0_9GAST|nr:semaphorin-5B-like [Elysia marginata]
MVDVWRHCLSLATPPIFVCVIMAGPVQAVVLQLLYHLRHFESDSIFHPSIDAGPQWGDWAPWSACSVTCHRGWRMRSRNCEDSTNGMSLPSGHCYGASQEYGTCELQQCPRWETWGAWGECSTETTCGSGVKVRHRACSNGGTGGVDRYCLGLANESAPCNSVPCNGPMRLAGGSVHGEGRVEIYDDQHQQWSLVCADQMTALMATMVCKQLGWPGGYLAVTDGQFGSGNGQFGLTSVTCKGSELTIAACEHNKWISAGICNGGATLAAGVQCDGSFDIRTTMSFEDGALYLHSCSLKGLASSLITMTYES